MIELIPVESSAIASVGYSDNRLIVEFVVGEIYKYVGVSENLFKELLAASSKGKFFNERIKPLYKGKLLTNQELETVCRILR